jgi:DNA-directed RNA polymerase subunit RPC12/RpoP
MVIKVFKCQMCGTQFEATVLDRDDSDERGRQGAALRCPKCNQTRVEEVRTLRRTGS